MILTECAEQYGVSAGHSGVDWAGREYYEHNGEVYRTGSHMKGFPIMPDGYRCARWEGSRAWFDRYRVVRCGRVDK